MSANEDEEFEELFGREFNRGGYVPEDEVENVRREMIEERRQELQQQEQKRNATLTPLLQEVDDEDNVVNKIEPPVVTRFGGTLPFDTNSTQLQCGETVTDESGDMNNRLNMEMELTHTQFKKLISMRNSSNSLKLVSAGYSGKATFDQIKWDRKPDANGVVYPDGTNQREAIYTVQLQTKEDTGL